METKRQASGRGLKAAIDFNKNFRLKDPNHDELKDGYTLNWVGKNYAEYLSGTETTTLIEPDIEHNKENCESDNIFITGDNLEMLKHLRSAYENQIDMIYIDPPYNTGEDFVYNDNFKFTDEQLEDALGLNDKEIKKMRNIEGKSSHSAWLTFMFPRLIIAKMLLKDEGVIFISIDDNEQANLKLLCDRIFDEGNFINQLVIETANGVFGVRASQASKTFVKNKDYVLVYAKNKDNDREYQQLYMPTNDRFDTHYSIMLNDKLCKTKFLDYIQQDKNLIEYFSKYKLEVSLENISKIMDIDAKFNEIMIGELSNKIYQDVDFTLKLPQEIDEETKNGKIVKYKDYIISRTNDGSGQLRQYLSFKDSLKNTDEYKSEYRKSVAIGDLWEGFDNDMKNVNKESNVPFDSPKPIRLIKQFAKWIKNPNAIILDFFAGSGTTAHAVMALNKEDKGRRKWILCQLDESTKHKLTENQKKNEKTQKSIKSNPENYLREGDDIYKLSEAYKAGYKTIDELSRARIKNAAKLLGDTSGFKHYRIKQLSEKTLENIDEWIFDKNALIPADMITPIGDIQTLLATWLIDDGCKFNTKIEDLDLDGYKAYFAKEYGRLYLIDNKNWSSKSLEELLNKLGNNEININTIVVYAYSFVFIRLTELKANKKILEQKITIEERY